MSKLGFLFKLIYELRGEYFIQPQNVQSHLSIRFFNTQRSFEYTLGQRWE